MYRLLNRICSLPGPSSWHRHISETSNKSIQYLIDGVLSRDRGKLAEAITLIESSHPKKKILAQQLLKEVLKIFQQNFFSTSFISYWYIWLTWGWKVYIY